MRILKCFFLLFPIILFGQSPLSQAEQQDFKDEVALCASKMESLSGDFVQTKHIQMMQDPAVSKGKLYFRTPDILKWEYSSPYNYKILFKNENLYIDDEGDKSVTSLESNKLFEKLISLISGSINGKLLEDAENFSISYMRDGNDICAFIVPKDPTFKEMFSKVILLFNQKKLIDSVKLIEASGDFTEIKFRNIQINHEIDNSVFKN